MCYGFIWTVFFYCTLGSGVHVQIVKGCCIGTYMAMWFAASIPPSSTSGISPHVLPPQPPLSLPYPHQQTPVHDAPSLCPCVLIVQHSPMSENMQCLIFCGFQIHPLPYKGHKLIVFYGCVVLHGIYVPHFLCQVCH